MLSCLAVRPILHHGAFALVVSTLALAPVVSLHAQKGKPPASPPDASATVAIPSNPDFAVANDGNAQYPGAKIFGPSGDLRLDLTTGTREILVTLGAPVPIDDASSTPPASAVYYTNAGLFVQDIRSVFKGTTVRRPGRIGFGDALPNHALGFRHTTAQGIVIYGTDTCVSRLKDEEAGTTLPTWRITSSAACAPVDADKAGVFEENIPGKINHKWKATYTVPFSFTVSCTSNCSM